MKLRWSGSILLTGDEWPGVTSGAGIYRIRAFNLRGNAMPIPRARDSDPEGILTIGESADLSNRLSTFLGRARGNAYSHSAADVYYSWNLSRLWKLDLLRFDFIHVVDKAAAERLELQALDDYRERFFDSPPLNRSQGKRQKHA